MLNQSQSLKYILLAQDATTKLTIGIVGQKLQIMRSAHEILADKEMLKGFSPEHAAIIGVIGGMDINMSTK